MGNYDAIMATAGQTASGTTRSLDPATAAGSAPYAAIMETGKIAAAQPKRTTDEGAQARAEMQEAWGKAKAWAQTPEGQRAIIETVGGVGLEVGAAAAAPPAALVRLLGRAAVTIWPMLAAATGGASGSAVAEQVDPSVNPLESAVKAGGEAFMGSGGGRGTVAALEGGLFKGSLKEGSEQAEGILSRNVVPGEEKLLVSPKTVSNSKALTFAEDVAQGAILSSRLEKRKKGTIVNAIEGMEQFVESFMTRGGNREDVGNMVVDAMEEASDMWRATGAGLAARLDSLAPNRAFISLNTPITIATRIIDPKSGKPTLKTVNTTMKEWAQTQLDDAEAGLGDTGTMALAKKIMEKPDQISFRDAQLLRSDLLGVGRKSGGDGAFEIAGKAQGAAKTLANAMDKTMEANVKNLNNLFRQPGAQPKGDELLNAWRTLNTHWKDGKDTFNHRLVRAIANVDPDAVVKQFIKNKAVGSIRRVRNMVNNKEVWGNVQGHYLRDLLERSIQKEGLSGASMKRNMRSMGDDALDELFPDKQHLANVKAWVNAVDESQKAMSKGTGSTLIQLTQGGSIALLLSGGLFTGNMAAGGAGAGAILLAPWAINRMLSNKTMAKYLTVGLKAPRGSKAAAAAAGQLLAQMNSHGLIEAVTSADPKVKQDFRGGRADVDKFATSARQRVDDENAANRAEVARLAKSSSGRGTGRRAGPNEFRGEEQVIAPPLRLR